MTENVYASALSIVDDNCYFMDKYFPAIYSLRKDGQTVLVEALGENAEVSCYSKALAWNNSLVYVPTNADEVVIFDTKEKTTERIGLPKEVSACKDKFVTGTIYENTLVLWGYCSDYVVSINLREKISTILWNLSESIKNAIGGLRGLLIRDALMIGNTIYAVSLDHTKIIVMDVIDDEIVINKEVEIDPSIKGVVGACEAMGELYLMPLYGNQLYKYDIRNYSIEAIDLGIEKAEWSYLAVQKVGNSVAIIPMNKSAIIRFDIDKKVLSYHVIEIEEGKREGRTVTSSWVDNSALYLSYLYLPVITKINFENMEMEHFVLNTSQVMLQSLPNLVEESTKYSLNWYLERLIIV